MIVKDELLEDAARLILNEGYASTSLVQRRLQLGYNRACRLFTQLEKCKVVGPSAGSKPREILVRNFEDIDFSLIS